MIFFEKLKCFLGLHRPEEDYLIGNWPGCRCRRCGKIIEGLFS